jgi:hypothetical protein
MVIVGAPHTSNWDFFLFLAVLHHFDVNVRFLAKHTLFRQPLGFMFRKVGGIPVDRSQPGGVVGQVERALESQSRMILVVAPEGTRDAAPKWKSGFVEIAERAGVPVVLAGVSRVDKSITISSEIDVGADRIRFMDQVRAFYADKDGINPSGKGPIRLGDEPVSS